MKFTSGLFMHGLGIYLLIFLLNNLLTSIVDSTLTITSAISCLLMLALNCLVIGNISKWSHDFWIKK